MSEIWGAVVGGLFVLAVLIGGGIGIAKCTKIDPGHVGVSVKKCDGGGVSKNPIPTGYYSRELFCEDVFEYPISMQSLILTKNPHEGTGGPDGAEQDQSISVTSSEGLNISLDVALNFTLDAKKTPAIYEKFRADIEHIAHTYIRMTIREGLALTFSKYTAEELYSTKKEVARKEVEDFLVAKLSPIGFVVSQFTINRVEPPAQVIQAINAKVAMAQEAQKAQQEVMKKTAEANQAVATAKGEADAMAAKAEGEAKAIKAKADAQAEANLTIAKSLTPELIEYEKAIHWNGALPQVTSGNTFMQLK